MSDSHKYHAFISYRHADNKQQGRQWAAWLHQAIETYEVPSDLIGKINGRGEEIPARIFPVFRDEEELPAHADLGKSIVAALDSTRLLIVLCSPNAVASTYVADEIDYFKRKGGSDRIIAAMLYGEPNTSWDVTKQASGFKAEDECFPIPLQFEYDEHGQRTSKHAEPIAADFRINNNGQPEQGWTTLEAYRIYLKEATQLNSTQIQEKIDKYEQQKHLMLLKIIAGIIGVPLGELTQRDKEYQLEQERIKAKKLRRWLSAVAMLAVIAIGAGVFAFFKQQEAVKAEQVAGEQRDKALIAEKIAREERDKALVTQSNFLLNQAKQENKKGNYDTALLLGLNAMPGIYGGERPIPELTHGLREALSETIKLAEFISKDNDKKNVYVVSPDGNTLARTSYTDSFERIFELISVSTGERLLVLPIPSTSQNDEYVFSPNGKLLLASSHRWIKVWSVLTGELLYTIEHGGLGYSTTIPGFSPDGRLIAATKNFDGSVVIWSADSGEKLQTIKYKADARYAAFSPDSKKLVAELANNTSVVSLVEGGEKLHTFNHKTGEGKAIFSPDSKKLATQISENTVQVWSIDTGKKLTTASHSNSITHYSFCPTRENRERFGMGRCYQSLVTTSYDKTTVFWSSSTGEKLQTWRHDSIPVAATFNKEGDYVITTLSNNTAVLWSVDSGVKRHTFTHNDKINHVAFSRYGGYIATASKDRTVILWDLLRGEKLSHMQHRDGVDHVIFRGGEETLVSLSKNKAATLWSTDGRTTIDRGKLLYTTFGVFSPDGNFLAVAANFGGIKLIRVDDGKQLHKLSHKGRVSYLAFDNSGENLAAVSNNTVTIWSVDKEEKKITLPHQDAVRYVSFSMDDKTIITISGDRHINLWSAVTGEKLKTLSHVGYITDLNLSSSGDRLVSVSGYGTAVVWSIPDGEKLKILQFQLGVANAVFTDDGASVLINSHSSDIMFWHLESGNEEILYQKNRLIAYSVFSPNKKILASIDGRLIGEGLAGETESVYVKLWDVDSGEEIHRLVHDDIVHFANFSPDGSKLLTSSKDNIAILWSVASGKKLRTFQLDSKIKHVDFKLNESAIAITSVWGGVTYSKLYQSNWFEEATQALPINRKCLSPTERERFALKKLDDNEWKVRGCWHFSNEAKNTNILIAAIRRDDAEAVKNAIRDGAKINSIKNNFPLGSPVHSGKEIITRLLRAGAKFDVHGKSLLIRFVEASNKEIVSLLLESGIDANNESGITPLQVAISQKNADIVSILLKAGVDANSKGELSRSPLQHAVLYKNNKIVSLLLKAGADVDVKDEFGTSLVEEAVDDRSVDLLKLLINAGADVNFITRYGDSPLMIAVRWGSIEMVQVLLGAGAEKSLKTPEGKTALDLAYMFKKHPGLIYDFNEEAVVKIEKIIEILE